MSKLPIIENWKCTLSDPYKPPEANPLVISGDVYGSSKHTDGDPIKTSPVQHIDGCIINTQNSQYILGEPDPHYIKWCKANHVYVPTKEKPIRNLAIKKSR